MRKLFIAIVAALAAPAGAQAADFVALTVDNTSVAPGWTLSATVTNGSSPVNEDENVAGSSTVKR